MHTILKTLVLVACLTAAASARDVYVNNSSGDDRNEGRAAAGVVRGGGPVRHDLEGAAVGRTRAIASWWLTPVSRIAKR